MKEIRAFLDALSEARSLADVNIAAGAALPVIARFARRTVAVCALALLVATAALAQGYTRLDHRLKQADEKHKIMLTSITKTTQEAAAGHGVPDREGEQGARAPRDRDRVPPHPARGHGRRLPRR